MMLSLGSTAVRVSAFQDTEINLSSQAVVLEVEVFQEKVFYHPTLEQAKVDLVVA